ncbi:MAG: dTDP-4-dehydrorhamnose reductase [bacterium]
MILVIGADGQVGWELQRTLSTLDDITTAGGHDADYALDLADANSIEHCIQTLQPRLIVNAAAYTAVDQAESDRDLAWAVNADALTVIGSEAKKLGIPVVHYSTDYVFSGNRDTPWNEDDNTEPRSVYGESKLAGERNLLASGADALIFRTCWVYGVRGKNFLLTMQRLFEERASLGVVADQHGTPTWSRMIAEATAQVVAQCRDGNRYVFGNRAGIYHLSAGGHASWYEFAGEILRASGLECELQPLTTAQYPTPAERPAWSVLDTSRLQRQFGIKPESWQKQLSNCLADLS